jgi:hypothetical protein
MYIIYQGWTYTFVEVAHGAVHEAVSRRTLALGLRTDIYGSQ